MKPLTQHPAVDADRDAGDEHVARFPIPDAAIAGSHTQLVPPARTDGDVMDEASFRTLLAVQGASEIHVRAFKAAWLPANEGVALCVAKADLTLRHLDDCAVRVQDVRIAEGAVLLMLAEPAPDWLAGPRHAVRLHDGQMATRTYYRGCWLQWLTPGEPRQLSREQTVMLSLRHELERALRDAWREPSQWPAEAAALLEATASIGAAGGAL